MGRRDHSYLLSVSSGPPVPPYLYHGFQKRPIMLAGSDGRFPDAIRPRGPRPEAFDFTDKRISDRSRGVNNRETLARAKSSRRRYPPTRRSVSQDPGPGEYSNTTETEFDGTRTTRRQWRFLDKFSAWELERIDSRPFQVEESIPFRNRWRII